MSATPMLSSREGLLALAERCEAVLEGNSALDANIYLAMFCRPTPSGYVWQDAGRAVDPVEFPWLHEDGRPTNADAGPTWPFTSSLDAARQLLPDALATWGVNETVVDELRFCRAHIHVGERDTHSGRGRSPELALCAAALRARASTL